MNVDQANVVISIIIPTVNQVELIIKCLNSFFESAPSKFYPYEVIVVDDGSSPEIQRNLGEALRPYEVQFITKPNNSGFSATVNCGAAASKGRYLCLLNNDVTLIQENWLDIMMHDMARVKAGLVGPRLLYPDGRIQHGGIIYVPDSGGFDHEFRGQPGDCPPALRTREVLGVTGALMLINRRLWERLGGMDERFFVGMEDVDFSLRTWEEGWRVYYCGAAVAVHPEGFTRGHDPYWQAKGFESGQKFAQKWQSRLYAIRRNARPIDGGGRPITVSEAQAALWRKIIARRKTQTYQSSASYRSNASQTGIPK